MSADARARAAGVLGVPTEATAPEAVAAFLSKLPTTGLVPPADTIAAANTLVGVALPRDPDAESGIGFPEEVEEFARTFWSLSPVERQERWTALGNRSDDRASDRLLALQAGLRVSAASRPNPTEEEVAAIARELFVLPSRTRAIRRNEWLLANAARSESLAHAADDLRRISPELAALDPVLFDRLTPGFPVSEFAAGATAEPLPAPPEPAPEPRMSIHHTRRMSQTAPVHSSGTTKQSSGGVPWYAIVAGILVIRLIAALGSSGSSNSSSSGTNFKPVTIPSYQQPSGAGFPLKNTTIPPGLGTNFTPTEVENFRAYEQQASGQPPFRYTEWLVAGRPEGKAVRSLSSLPSQTQVVIFSVDDIARFERHERIGTGQPPFRYDEWVRAGRPRQAGLVSVPAAKVE